MKDFVISLVRAIVDKPEKVEVWEDEIDELVRLRLKVDEEEMGRVIGRGGKIIKAIRALVRIRAIKEGKSVNLELLETG